MGKGVGLPRRQKAAIRLLFESGCAKTPSEAAVPAFSGWLLTRSGVWRKRRSLVAGMSFKGRREDDEEKGYLNKEEENRKGSRRRNEAKAKRSQAKRRSCSAVVMIKKGWGLFVARTIIQYSAGRQIVTDWGVLGDSNMRGWEGSLGSAKSRQCLGLGCMG